MQLIVVFLPTTIDGETFDDDDNNDRNYSQSVTL